MKEGEKSDLDVKWFEQLWDCAGSLKGFYYSPGSPSSLKEADFVILKSFEQIQEDISKEDSIDKALIALKEFSLNTFANYIESQKNPANTIDLLKIEWTTCHIFIEQLRIINSKFPDAASLICKRCFNNCELLEPKKINPDSKSSEAQSPKKTSAESITVNRKPADIQNEITDSEELETMKTEMLFLNIIESYEATPNKEVFLIEGMKLKSNKEDLERIESIAEEIQKHTKCDLILKEKNAKFEKRIVFLPPENKSTPDTGDNRSDKPVKEDDTKPSAETAVVSSPKKVESDEKPKIIFKKSDTETDKVMSVNLSLGAPENEPQSLTKKFGPGFISTLVHIAVIILLAAFLVTEHVQQKQDIEVTLSDNEKKVDLEDVQKVEEETNLEVTQPEASSIVNKLNKQEMQVLENAALEVISDKVDDVPAIEPTESLLPDSFDFTSVKTVGVGKYGVFSNRGFKNRDSLLKKFGGTKAGQEALLKGLQYLKETQKPDGSWEDRYNESMTALAMLAFLAYGATPEHPKFGKTVEKGLEWMLETARNQRGKQIGAKGGSGYQHPIFTFAMCEATCMIPYNTELFDATEDCVKTLIAGQCKDGGFPYIYRSNSTSALTLTGWNALAYKAAVNASVQAEGIHEVKYELIDYFKSRYKKNDGFIYGGAVNGAHRGIGTIGLQYLDDGKCAEVKDIINVIKTKDLNNIDKENLYALYYLNQAIFNEGSTAWKDWAEKLQTHLVDIQQDSGKWVKTSYYNGQQQIMSTSLACLMLTVFYRYPPTYEGTPKPMTQAQRIKAIEQKKRNEKKVVDLEEEGMNLID